MNWWWKSLRSRSLIAAAWRSAPGPVPSPVPWPWTIPVISRWERQTEKVLTVRGGARGRQREGRARVIPHQSLRRLAPANEAGLDSELAPTVATQLMTHDALGAHGRNELGISETVAARPVQAAFATAGTFAVGAALPLQIVVLCPASVVVWSVSCSSLVFLALLGSLAARAGGAPVIATAWRVTFWGALAMALTAGVGALFGVGA